MLLLMNPESMSNPPHTEINHNVTSVSSSSCPAFLHDYPCPYEVWPRIKKRVRSVPLTGNCGTFTWDLIGSCDFTLRILRVGRSSLWFEFKCLLEEPLCNQPFYPIPIPHFWFLFLFIIFVTSWNHSAYHLLFSVSLPLVCKYHRVHRNWSVLFATLCSRPTTVLGT